MLKTATRRLFSTAAGVTSTAGPTSDFDAYEEMKRNKAPRLKSRLFRGDLHFAERDADLDTRRPNEGHLIHRIKQERAFIDERQKLGYFK